MKLTGVILLAIAAFSFSSSSMAQGKMKWVEVDSAFGPLPSSVHVFRSADPIDGKPNIAYYVVADLKDKNISFTTDTTLARRFTPGQFYERNNKPVVVVNTTFFSFATNQNLNTVIKDGKQVGYMFSSNAKKEFNPILKSDTSKIVLPYGSAIGISSKRKPDIAWMYTDSSSKWPIAWQHPVEAVSIDLSCFFREKELRRATRKADHKSRKSNGKGHEWKMETAVGGGPVLLQEGKVSISNDNEKKFAGKAIDDKHPRTAMGYTKDNKLIILVIEGRNPGIAEGATLTQEAFILQELGCVEALNLDGGGSSCLLVNGKETIWPSDKGVQRPVPAVFLIK